MDSMFEAYINRLERRDRARSTIRQNRDALALFDRWLKDQGVRRPQDCTPELAEEFFYDAQRDYKDNTRRFRLQCVRAAYSYAMKRGACSHDPTYDVEIRAPEPLRKSLTIEELRAIRDEVRTELELIGFTFLAYTGMRRFEITKMRWERVDLAGCTLNVKGKGGKNRLVPIHPALGEVLAETERVSPWVLNAMGRQGMHPITFGYRVKDLADRAGVEATSHDFRRTVASSLIGNGVHADVVDQILGWGKDTVRTRHYVQVASEPLQQAILRLYEDDPL